jgi:hypothetical protein
VAPGNGGIGTSRRNKADMLRRKIAEMKGTIDNLQEARHQDWHHDEGASACSFTFLTECVINLLSIWPISLLAFVVRFSNQVWIELRIVP